MIRTSAFLNLISSADKQKYVNECWDLLQAAYAAVGGFKSADSPDDLVRDSFMWKLARKNGKVVACCIYKKQFGRKRIASATDNTSTGKAELMAIYKEDLTRAWTECSGAVERALMKLGGEHFMIPAEHAPTLTGKECIPSEDGFHYKRKIAGSYHEKVIIGTPEGSW